MSYSKFKKCGFALAEVLITLAALTTTVIVLGVITNNALSTTNLSKDYLVAQNLVTEGVEAVKNLRDTNWLIYPDKKQCWLTLVANCTTQGPNNNSNYIIVLSNGVLKLFKPSGDNPLDLDSSDLSNKTPYRLYIKNSQYVGYPAPYSGAITSKYFRSIKFISITDTDADNVTDYVTIEVKVQWKDGAKTKEINKTITLNNYL